MNNFAMELDENNHMENTDVNKELNNLKNKVDKVIEDIMKNNERLVFVNVVKAAEISQITVFKYPEIRSYILVEIKKQKEINCINNKINKIVSGMIKRKSRITYVGVMNRCKFSQEELKNYPHIKGEIRKAVIEGSKTFYKVEK